MSHYIDYQGEIKLARTLAQKAGLHICLEKTDAPRTDGRTIYLQQPDPNWSEEQWVRWRGLFYHEVGHNVPAMRDIFKWLKENQVSTATFYGGLINCTDDYRQERFEYDKYLGRQRALSRANGIFMRELVDEGRISKLAEQAKTDKYSKAILAMMAYDIYRREDWQIDVAGYGTKFRDLLDAEGQGWVDKLRAGDYYDKLQHGSPKATDVVEVIERVMNEVFEMDSSQEKEKAQDKKAGAGKVEGKGEQAESSALKPGDSYADLKVKWEDVLIHNHDEDKPSYNALHIEYPQNPTQGAYIPYPEEDIIVVHYPSQSMIQGPSSSYLSAPNGSYASAMKELDSGVNLSKRIERLMMIQSRDKYKYGKKRGKLHGPSLYRVTMKDAHGYNQRVFKQREENDCLDVAVSVLMDCSGSMGGRKIVIAGHSLVLLNELLRPMRIPYELLGFTDSRRAVLYIYKGFTDRAPYKDKLIEYIAQSTNCMRNNADADAIMFTARRLAQQKTKRKLLIVLSDGQPAGGNEGDIAAGTKQVISRLEEQSTIEPYGIGIQNMSIESLYKQYQVIDNPAGLDEALLRLIHKKILKRV